MNSTQIALVNHGPWRGVRLSILAVGPFASLTLLSNTIAGSYQGEVLVVAAVNALAWSPLFFSVPALLMQSERDAFAPEARRLLPVLRRSASLIPHLLLSARSPVRLEMAVSIAAWVLLLMASGGDIVAGINAML